MTKGSWNSAFNLFNPNNPRGIIYQKVSTIHDESRWSIKINSRNIKYSGSVLLNPMNWSKYTVCRISVRSRELAVRLFGSGMSRQRFFNEGLHQTLSQCHLFIQEMTDNTEVLTCKEEWRANIKKKFKQWLWTRAGRKTPARSELTKTSYRTLHYRGRKSEKKEKMGSGWGN